LAAVLGAAALAGTALAVLRLEPTGAPPATARLLRSPPRHAVDGRYLPRRYEVVEQVGARIPAGGDVRLYFVGGSNTVWQTWPDQMHAYLRKLNYTVPAGSYKHLDATSPLQAPVCDDEAEFRGLITPRIGRPGWGSWGFAYDSQLDCSDAPLVREEKGEFPFRTIAGHPVSCLNGWACKPESNQSRQVVRPSDIAEDAKMADVVMLSTWVNDFKQQYCKYKCYNGTKLEPEGIAPITIANLRRVIRAIHAVNPNAFVVVVALYPDAEKSLVVEATLEWIASINSLVSEGVSVEPNVAFVDFALTPGQDMFQVKPPGHPNCRGDRLMATQVLRTLFDRKILGRALALPEGDRARECLSSLSCGEISDKACCQAAGVCRLDPSGACVAYGPGLGSL